MVFIDLEKAYDNAKRSFKMSINEKEVLNTYINMVEDMYEGS